MKMKCACGRKRNGNSKDKRQLAATDVENKKSMIENFDNGKLSV